jgi:hypothetical protein
MAYYRHSRRARCLRLLATYSDRAIIPLGEFIGRLRYLHLFSHALNIITPRSSVRRYQPVSGRIRLALHRPATPRHGNARQRGYGAIGFRVLAALARPRPCRRGVAFDGTPPDRSSPPGCRFCLGATGPRRGRGARCADGGAGDGHRARRGARLARCPRRPLPGLARLASPLSGAQRARCFGGVLLETNAQPRVPMAYARWIKEAPAQNPLAHLRGLVVYHYHRN